MTEFTTSVRSGWMRNAPPHVLETCLAHKIGAAPGNLAVIDMRGTGATIDPTMLTDKHAGIGAAADLSKAVAQFLKVLTLDEPAQASLVLMNLHGQWSPFSMPPDGENWQCSNLAGGLREFFRLAGECLKEKGMPCEWVVLSAIREDVPESVSVEHFGEVQRVPADAAVLVH